MNATLHVSARLAFAAVAILAAAAAHAYDGIVKKEVFTLPSYTTVGGKTIKDVSVGYETYGKLNAAGDNVLCVIDVASGEILKKVGTGKFPCDLHFTPDGRFASSASSSMTSPSTA